MVCNGASAAERRKPIANGASHGWEGMHMKHLQVDQAPEGRQQLGRVKLLENCTPLSSLRDFTNRRNVGVTMCSHP
jgi:hypothetical protein